RHPRHGQFVYRAVQGYDAGADRLDLRSPRTAARGFRRSQLGDAGYAVHGLCLCGHLLFPDFLCDVALCSLHRAPAPSRCGAVMPMREKTELGVDIAKRAVWLVMRTTQREVAVDIMALNKWFGSFHVLRDVSLKVMRGERIVICGPSGSGKSTLLRCVNRIEDWQQGRVIVDGVELTEDLKTIDEVRREVGMVFQQFNLFPHLTVLENCTLAPTRVRHMPRRAAEELARHYLARVRIPEQADKYPLQLSGGQQQRVAIARALCMQPK